MTFYYLDMYIFCISDHKPGTCLTILKDYWKGCCIIRAIMQEGLFCYLWCGYNENYAQIFFCSSVFVSVCVFNVWPKITLLLPVWRRNVKGWTPLIYSDNVEAWVCGYRGWSLDSQRLWNWNQGYQHKVRHGREALVIEKGGKALPSRRKGDDMD